MASAHAVEPVVGISSMATREVLFDLAEAYRRASGQPVAVESIGGVDVVRRVQAGETFDFVVLAAEAIDRLAGAGQVDAASRTRLARSEVAVAVPAGAKQPDIGAEDAVRRAVLAARSVGFSTGPSGAHLVQLFARWGIAEAIASRLVQAPPGIAVGTLIARGDVDLGFQQLSELRDLPGVAVVGPLPPAIQLVTVFCGAVCATATRPEAARAFLAFVASPEAGAAKRRHGMEPA